MRDWVRTAISSGCGGVIGSMVVVESMVLAAPDPDGVNLRALALFGGIGLGAGLVAWLVRRRDRGDDLMVVADVLSVRGELSEADEELIDPGVAPVREGDGYVWPAADMAEVEARMQHLDLTNGWARAAHDREECVLEPEQESAFWVLMDDLRRPPVPVVPGREADRA